MPRVPTGQAGLLTGVPIAHKDIFCAEGWLTTCGSKMLSNFVSPYDAHVIEQFKAAGMPCLGKTNMDEFAMGSSNETSFYGPVKNPWDTARVPGGSSGGSAACVAARLAPAATGTDTGGSIRQPAALCGITGLKPTYGVVSRYGMIAFASSLDQGGPMAQTAEDCALLLNVMAGFDTRDSTSLERPKEDYTRDLNQAPGRPEDRPAPRVFRRPAWSAIPPRPWRKPSRSCAQTGRDKPWKSACPIPSLSVAAYYVLAPAEASSNLSRFDGVRYGYRTPNTAISPTCTRRPAPKASARGQAPHHDRRLRAVAWLLRRLLHPGPEAAPPDRQRFRRSLQAMRRDPQPDRPDHCVQTGRKNRRPGGDVSVRHLHHRGQSGRPARHVAAVRLRCARACPSVCN
jgi:Asp-tRNA(Asn)/Glu-tRNA(Gln) amidotransferase A subunit family amidase